MNKNEANEKLAGYYQMDIVGNTIVFADEDGNRGIAKCDPADEFDVEVGMKLAFSRLLDAQNQIEVGDIVKVVDSGFCYPVYSEWVATYVKSELKCRYSFNHPCEVGTIGRVIVVDKHPDFDDTLVYFQTGNYPKACYLINVKGLKKVG